MREGISQHRVNAGAVWRSPTFMILLVLTVLLVAASANAGVIYVDSGAFGANNGSSWANAYTDLQNALAAAVIGDEIWIAAGTYKPTIGGDRTISFVLRDGVGIYGGFAGGESTRGDRNWETYTTTLSGDIGAGGNSSDNSYHVVRSTAVTGSAVLDGFTVTGGNANGAFPHDEGGGMANNGGSPTVANCTFVGNSSGGYGGGMSNFTANPTVTNCTFVANSAPGNGSGIFNSPPSVLILKNSILADNGAEDLFNMATVSSSHSIVETSSGFTADATDITGHQPSLNIGPLADNGGPTLTHALLAGSVAIDAGTAAGAPGTDQRGVARDASPDIGAYEFALSIPTVSTTTPSSITATSASSGGNVVDDGGAVVTARGVCWSKSAGPLTSDSCTSDGSGTGAYASAITGLSSNTTFHVRAYATNSSGTAYGSDLTLATTSPSVSFTAASQSGAENAGTMTITAQLSVASGLAITVPFTVGGSATGGGTDYSITASPVTIPAGATTQTITITISDDALDENSETVVLTMGSPTNATQGATTVHTATITDNDDPPTVSFTAASQSGAENAGTMTITAQLSGASSFDVGVPFTSGGSATAGGTDYSITASPVTIPAGATTQSITITINDDALDENSETVVLNMGSPTNATQGATTVHRATITDDDTAAMESTKTAALTLDQLGDGEANPTDELTYTVTLTNTGSATVTGVAFTDPIPTNTRVVAGSVTTTQGTVTSEDPVGVDMGDLAVGGTATITFRVTIDKPFPIGVDSVSNQGTVSSVELPSLPTDDPATPAIDDPTVTPIVNDPDLAATKVDALVLDADGDTVPSPGDEIEYTIILTNTGGPATGVSFMDAVPAHTSVVAGSVTATQGTVVSESPVEITLGDVAPDAVVTTTFRVTIDNPIAFGVGDVENQGTILSDQLPAVLTDDPDVGGTADPTVTSVTSAPHLLAEKTDALLDDADGNAVPSPGDTVRYTIRIFNLGNTASSVVSFADVIPEHTSVVAGSVTTTVGTVLSEDPVSVDVGLLGVGPDVTVTFDVSIVNPIPVGVAEVSNQGMVSSAELADVLTDDPEVGGTADPTITAVTSAPVLMATKVDHLFGDHDSNGVASPGDEIVYQIAVTNSGNTGATGVLVDDPIPVSSTLVAGSLQTSQGTVLSEDPATVDLGLVQAGVAAATLSFRVLVADPFPIGVDSVSNQGTVSSVELAAVLTDDPDVGGAADPTVTELASVPVDVVAQNPDSDQEIGYSADYTFRVTNTGSTADSYDLVGGGLYFDSLSTATTGVLDPTDFADVTVTADVGCGAALGVPEALSLTATSQSMGSVTDSESIAVAPTETNAGSGGGYHFANSLAVCAPSIPVFDWVDISAEISTVDVIGSLDDDSFIGPIPIGFTFTFFGNDHSELYISSNGWISFDGIDPGAAANRDNTALPDSGAPNNLIAVFWDDMNPDDLDPGNTHAYHGAGPGGSKVVTFERLPEYSADPDGWITTQVILFPDGRIKIQNKERGPSIDLAGATVGLESSFGTTGLQYHLNSSGGVLFSSPMAIMFGADQNNLPVTLESFIVEKLPCSPPSASSRPSR